MKVQGYEFHIPNKSIDYIERQYGKNWKTPMRMDPGSENYTKFYDGKSWVPLENGMSRYLTKRVKESSPEHVRKDEK